MNAKSCSRHRSCGRAVLKNSRCGGRAQAQTFPGPFGADQLRPRTGDDGGGALCSLFGSFRVVWPAMPSCAPPLPLRCGPCRGPKKPPLGRPPPPPPPPPRLFFGPGHGGHCEGLCCFANGTSSEPAPRGASSNVFPIPDAPCTSVAIDLLKLSPTKVNDQVFEYVMMVVRRLTEPPRTTNRQPPPTANCRQLPPTANRQLPPTANHYSILRERPRERPFLLVLPTPFPP